MDVFFARFGTGCKEISLYIVTIDLFQDLVCTILVPIFDADQPPSQLTQLLQTTLPANHSKGSPRFAKSQVALPQFLFPILYQPEAQGAGTVHAWRHHQQFTVLVQFVSLRKIPN